jgi:hypothetical protein
MHITTMARQVKNWVTYDLARSVEGYISSPAHTMNWDQPWIQQMSFISSSAQSENRRMLKQEKRVLSCFLTPLPKQFFLPGQRLDILNQAKVDTLKVHHEN